MHRVVQRMPHPLGQRLQHRHLHRAAAPRRATPHQRREDPRERVHRRRDVGRRDPRLHRLLGRPRHGHQPRLALHEHVVRAFAGVRPEGPVTRDVHGDQPRVGRAQRRRVQAEPRGGPLCEVLHEDVGVRDETAYDVQAARVLQVEGDGLLAAVAPHEVRGETGRRGVVAAREVTAVDPLDLDDPGPEIGELPGGEGGRDGLFDGDDGDALQGQGKRLHARDHVPRARALSCGGRSAGRPGLTRPRGERSASAVGVPADGERHEHRDEDRAPGQ